MEPDELSEAVLEIVALAQDRVGPGSIGAEQYHTPGEPQKFETMTHSDFLQYYLEEALDMINYGVMLSIKIHRLMLVMKEIEDDEADSDLPSESAGGLRSPGDASGFAPSTETTGLQKVLPDSSWVQDPGQRDS